MAIAGFLFYFKFQVEKPALGSGTISQVKISEGESTAEIGKKLESENLIRSANCFYLYEKIKNKPVIAGDYLLPNNLSIKSISDILSKGEKQVIRITIPEGWRAEQIATRLEEKAGIPADEFYAEAKSREGKLFPDTYDLMDKPTISEVLKKMDDDFVTRISGLSVSGDDLILASIVEREAADDSERADIAGVFANRLKIGMKLEADPTVQYQKDTNLSSNAGISNYDFWQKLDVGDLHSVIGPFNTYLNKGLPPAPICNPGIKSIEAAVNPAKHNYYYFFHGSDGKIYFSQTEAEHNQKKKLYL